MRVTKQKHNIEPYVVNIIITKYFREIKAFMFAFSCTAWKIQGTLEINFMCFDKCVASPADV